MKKIKIMLMSAIVIAAVGGALAFKANTFSTNLKCGTATNSCATIIKATFDQANEGNFNTYCTDGTQNVDCTYALLEP